MLKLTAQFKLLIKVFFFLFSITLVTPLYKMLLSAPLQAFKHPLKFEHFL